MSLSKAETAHRTAGLVYCLWLLGILFGITAIIGMFINHTKLASVRGTHAYSHFIWQMVSFWLVIAGAFISILLWPGPAAQLVAIGSFFVWLFSGLIGSWYLSRSKRLSFLDHQARTVKHPHHLRGEVHNENYEQI